MTFRLLCSGNTHRDPLRGVARLLVLIRGLVAPAGVQRNLRCLVLFSLTLCGFVFASALLVPDNNDILEAAKRNVCSLMYTVGLVVIRTRPSASVLSK